MCKEYTNFVKSGVETCSIIKMLLLPPEQRNFTNKCEIFNQGRPTPQWLPLKLDNGNVIKINALDLKLFEIHKWMTGCTTLNKIFCWPCLFFNTNPWSISGSEYAELNTYCIDKHITSSEHINATKECNKFPNQETSPDDLNLTTQEYVPNSPFVNIAPKKIKTYGKSYAAKLRSSASSHISQTGSKGFPSTSNFIGGAITERRPSIMNSISKSSSETTQNYNIRQNSPSIYCDGESSNLQQNIAVKMEDRIEDIEEINLDTIQEATEIKDEFTQKESNIDEDPLSIPLHENMYHDTHHLGTEFILPNSNKDVMLNYIDIPGSNKRQYITMLDQNDAKRFKDHKIIVNNVNEPSISILDTQYQIINCQNKLGYQSLIYTGSDSVIPKETILTPVIKDNLSHSSINVQKGNNIKTCVNSTIPVKQLVPVPPLVILKTNESTIQSNSSTQVAPNLKNIRQYFILPRKTSTSTLDYSKNGVIPKLLSIPNVILEIVNGIKNITISYEIYEIILLGRPKPELTKLKPANHEKNCKCGFDDGFDTSVYERIDWLTGCKITNKLFCWPCLLFTFDRTHYYGTGYDDLGCLSNDLKTHIKGYYHQQAVNMFNEFCKKHVPPKRRCLLQNPSDAKAISSKFIIPPLTLQASYTSGLKNPKRRMNKHDEKNSIMKLLSIPFQNKISVERLEILRQGRPTPPLPYDKYDDKKPNPIHPNHVFTNYTITPWLTGCSKTNTLYCWTCLLFNKIANKWNTGLGFDVNPSMYENIIKHNKDTSHYIATTKYKYYQNLIQICTTYDNALSKIKVVTCEKLSDEYSSAKNLNMGYIVPTIQQENNMNARKTSVQNISSVEVTQVQNSMNQDSGSRSTNSSDKDSRENNKILDIPIYEISINNTETKSSEVQVNDTDMCEFKIEIEDGPQEYS